MDCSWQNHNSQLLHRQSTSGAGCTKPVAQTASESKDWGGHPVPSWINTQLLLKNNWFINIQSSRQSYQKWSPCWASLTESLSKPQRATHNALEQKNVPTDQSLLLSTDPLPPSPSAPRIAWMPSFLCKVFPFLSSKFWNQSLYSILKSCLKSCGNAMTFHSECM